MANDNLTMIADNEGIEFVYGKGKRKPALQQLHEELEQCGKRLMEYKEFMLSALKNVIYRQLLSHIRLWAW